MNTPRILTCLALGAAMAAGAVGCSNEIKVGAIVSESGPATVYGGPVRRGLELAADEINSGGGFHGKPIALVFRDDKTRTEDGVAAAVDLIDNEGVKFIVGAVSSPVTLAIAPLCNEKRVLLMSPSASADAVTAAGDYVYRVYPADILEATAMADFARDLGIESVVLFTYDNDWGRGLRDVFTQKYASKFRQIVQTFEFAPGDTSSFATWAAEVADMAPEGVYVAAYANDWGELIRALRAAGVKSVQMGTSAFTPKVVEIAGEAAEHLLFAQPSFLPASDYPPARQFAEAYRSKYGSEPDRYAAYGYDALRVLYRAMVEADTTHVDNVRIGLGSLDNFEGATGRITFDSHGDVVQYPQTFVIQDGRPVPWETFIEQGGTLKVPGRD